MAERLRITVLPTLALIKKGKVDDYVVGFDALGGTDDFDTKTLEERLARQASLDFTSVSRTFFWVRSEVIFANEVPATTVAAKKQAISKGLAFQKTASDEDSDFDD